MRQQRTSGPQRRTRRGSRRAVARRQITAPGVSSEEDGKPTGSRLRTYCRSGHKGLDGEVCSRCGGLFELYGRPPSLELLGYIAVGAILGLVLGLFLSIFLMASGFPLGGLALPASILAGAYFGNRLYVR